MRGWTRWSFKAVLWICFNVVVWQAGNIPDEQVRKLRNIRNSPKRSQGSQASSGQHNDLSLEYSQRCWWFWQSWYWHTQKSSPERAFSSAALQDEVICFEKPKTLWLHSAKIPEEVVEQLYALMWHEQAARCPREPPSPQSLGVW